MPSLYVCNIVDVTGCACCSFMISDLLCVNSSLLTVPAECSVSIALPVICKYVTVSFRLVHVTVLGHPGLGFFLGSNGQMPCSQGRKFPCKWRAAHRAWKHKFVLCTRPCRRSSPSRPFPQ